MRLSDQYFQWIECEFRVGFDEGVLIKQGLIGRGKVDHQLIPHCEVYGIDG